MNQIIVATNEELLTLTPREREIYRMFRIGGKRFEEIASELQITGESVRKKWNTAMRKIRMNRNLEENPQYFLHRGRDVLRSSQEYGQLSGPAASMRTIGEISDTAELRLFEATMHVKILRDLAMDVEGFDGPQLFKIKGTIAVVDEVYEASNPPFCVVVFAYEGKEMAASIMFDDLEPT